MLRGDYGPDQTARTVQPGEVITVPDFQAKRMRHLEERGCIEELRKRPSIMAKALTAYQNKSLRASPANK